MSHRINIEFACPRCKHEIKAEIYRSIWGERPENRELVFSDKINRIPCPKCGFVIFPNASLMYTHVVLKFAVWFEPVSDPSINAGNAMLPKIVPYLRTAKRINDWNEFKATIENHEKGAIVTENNK